MADIEHRCSLCGRRMWWSKLLRDYICPVWDHVGSRPTRRDKHAR